MDITLPNGRVIQGVPEGTTKEEVMQRAIAGGLATEADFGMSPAAPTAQPQGYSAFMPSMPEGVTGYMQNTAQNLQNLDIAGSLSQYLPNVQRRLETVTPEGFSPLPTDVLSVGASQAARTGGEIVTDVAGAVIPQRVKDFFGDAVEYLGQAPEMQMAMSALGNGYEAWQSFSKSNPETAERIGTYVDVASLLSPRPDLTKLLEKEARLARSGANMSKQQVEREATVSMLEPEHLGSDVVDEVGIIRSKKWMPGEADNTMIDVLQTIDTFDPFRSYTYNYRQVQKHVSGQKEALDKFVKNQNTNIDIEDLRDELRLSFDDFVNTDEFKLSSDDAQKMFEKLARVAADIVEEEGTDLVGVLNARRRFDKAIRNQMGSGVLDADVATVRANAAKTVRATLNDYLKRNTKGDEVHHLLDQQYHSLNALDRMENHRNREGRNAIARAMNVLEEYDIALPKTPLAIAATAVAVTNPGVATMAAGAAGVGFVGYQIKKHGKSYVLKGLAQTLEGINKGLKAAKKANNPANVQALEADRLILIDLINEAREYESGEEE